MTIEGYTAQPGENMNPYCNAVSADYFKTMGIPLVQGRDFDDRDVRYAPIDQTVQAPPPYKAAIVNESFAKRYFGDRSPIGRHIGFGINPGTKTPIEIVGVVKDAKYTGVRDEIPRQVFFPFLEAENNGGVIYVRTNAQPDSAFTAIRLAVREMDANVPVYNLRTLEHQIDQSLLNDRIIATLSMAFGALATLLAVIGLYGVMAYTVARRTREIGVRMALGALPGNVVWMVMREVLMLVGTGVVLGLGAAWGLSRVVSAQLYGVSPTDPVTIVAAAGTLATVALLAGYIPAIRATRVNPVRALRYE
jgi:predicted permease